MIVSETRMGRHIPPTLLRAEVVESAGCDVVKDFSLAGSLDDWKTKKNEKAEQKSKVTYEQRVMDYLRSCENQTATQESVLQHVEGRRERLSKAIEELKTAAVLTVSGVKQSPTNPLTLTLNPDSLFMYRLGHLGVKAEQHQETLSGALP